MVRKYGKKKRNLVRKAKWHKAHSQGPLPVITNYKWL